MLLVACSEDNVVTKDNTGDDADIVAQIPDFVPYHMDELPESRSTINWGTVGGKPNVTFSWENGDALAVFSSTKDNNSKMIYNIEENPNGNSATFTGQDYRLTDGIPYYAFSPASLTNDNGTKNSIQVSFANQNQVENKSTAHLGAYDYLAACTKISDNGAKFMFKRLCAIVRVRVGFADFASDKKVRIKKFELVRQDNVEIPYERTICLSASSEVDNEYKPTILPAHSPIPGNSKRQSFVLNLGAYNGETHDYDGIEVGKYNSTNDFLVMYMMLPDTEELKNLPLQGILTDTEGKEYYISMTGYDFVGGTYNSYAEIRPTIATEVGLKIHVAKDWQVGHTEKQTRAATAGDPGVTEKLDQPDHLYVYITKKGGDDKYYYYDTQTIVAPENEKWTETSTEWIYKDNVVFKITESDPELHAFVVASKGEIASLKTPTFSKGTTEESVIKAKTFDIPSTATDDTKKQDYLKNIYSAFHEIPKDVPSIAATVYHVATLMDVQWNSTAGLTINNAVGVNNMPSTNLNLFGATAAGTGTTWSPSATITAGTKWNGRETFYVPNLSTGTYSIKVNNADSNVSFPTPETTDKGAPWLKANITCP